MLLLIFWVAVGLLVFWVAVGRLSDGTVSLWGNRSADLLHKEFQLCVEGVWEGVTAGS